MTDRHGRWLDEERYERARKAKALDHGQVAANSRIPKRRLYSLRRKRKPASDAELERLAAALGVPPDELEGTAPPAAPARAPASTRYLGLDGPLEELLREVTSKHVVCVRGDAQVGKSTLIEEMGRRLQADGRHVFLTEAPRMFDEAPRGGGPVSLAVVQDRLEKFLSDVEDPGGHGGPERLSDPGGVRDRQEDLHERLDRDDLVLVFDDLHFHRDPALRAYILEHLAESSGRFRLVIASRTAVDIAPSVALHTIHLEPWSQDQCSEYFAARGHTLTEEQAEIVHTVTFGLPGLCVSIASYVDRGHAEVSHVLDAWREPFGEDERRHPSASAAIDFIKEWVLAGLDDRERKALFDLATFTESIDHERAVAFIGAGAEEVLGSLVDVGMVELRADGRLKAFDTVAELIQRFGSDLHENHLRVARFYQRMVDEPDRLLSLAYPGNVWAMYYHFNMGDQPRTGVTLLQKELLRWIQELNQIRNLTYAEREAAARTDRSDRMRRTLDICFRVVETFEEPRVALDELLSLIADERQDNLVRAQPMYFILMARLHTTHMRASDWRSLLARLRKEPNAHVIFHVLQALGICVRSGTAGFGDHEGARAQELREDVEELLAGFREGNWTCTDPIVALYARYLEADALADGDAPADERRRAVDAGVDDLLRDFRAALERVEALESVPVERRLVNNQDTEAHWEAVELTLFTVGDLAGAQRLSAERALAVLERALSSRFWIIRWWAITNLSKIRSTEAVDILLDEVAGTFDGRVPLFDLGLLAVRSLARLFDLAREEGDGPIRATLCARTDELLDRTERVPPSVRSLLAALRAERRRWAEGIDEA